MAKRAAPDEKPYRPLLDAELVSAALSQAIPPPPSSNSATTKVIDIARAETPRRHEVPLASEPVASHNAPELRDSEPNLQAVQSLVEKFDQEKRILFTRSETQAIDRLVIALAGRLNAQVKVSHVIRALVALLLHAEAQVDKRAGETGPLVRPPNGDAKALQQFEREIARIIAAALRDAGPPR